MALLRSGSLAVAGLERGGGGATDWQQQNRRVLATFQGQSFRLSDAQVPLGGAAVHEKEGEVEQSATAQGRGRRDKLPQGARAAQP